MVQGITLTGSRSTWLEAVGWDFGRPRKRLYMAVELGDAEFSAFCGHRQIQDSGPGLVLASDSAIPHHGSVVFNTHLNP
jgi:hypothetical protein